MCNYPFVCIDNGLVTLEDEAVEIIQLLERKILTWAKECGAHSMVFPPLMRVEDLESLDYFKNFPHLGLAATGIQDSKYTEYSSGKSVPFISNDDLKPTLYMLPSAACYNAYLYLKNTQLSTTKYITTVARCFRNEDHYVGLQRLWGFSMREIICIGSADEVQIHLKNFKEKILQFSKEIGLPLETKYASDPFYYQQGPKALMQKLSPVKEEFVYDDTVAIASVNFHRNFFGERCNIRLNDDSYAFSGCVAFGLERWLHALLSEYGTDFETIVRKFRSEQWSTIK